MVKKGERKRTYNRTKPFYSLGRVKKLVKTGKVLIRRNALDGARDSFGWDVSDMLDALNKLQIKHFYKREESNFTPKIPFDFYKAHDLKGEDVYTHFYIDNDIDMLIVDSFKKI